MYYFNRFNRKDYKNSGRHFFSKKTFFRQRSIFFFNRLLCLRQRSLQNCVLQLKGGASGVNFSKSQKKVNFSNKQIDIFFST